MVSAAVAQVVASAERRSVVTDSPAVLVAAVVASLV